MKLKTIFASFLAAFGLQASGLDLGAPLPEVSNKNHLGKEVKIEAAKDHRWLLVFFYPKALTGGWTKQACSVRDAFEKLTEKKVTVFGVSTDSVEKQKKFVDKNKLTYSLIADQEGKVAKALGVPLIFGGKLASRSAFLFKDGKLVWKDTKGATGTQGEDVLKAMEALEKAD